MTGRAFASPHRTPAHLGDCVMTLRRPSVTSALLACGRFGSGACRPGRITRSARRPATSSRVHLHLGVLARDRPAAPKQSADRGTTGGSVTTGPILSFLVDRAPLLRFGPLQHTPAASRAVPEAAGLRTIPLRCFAPRPPALDREPRSAALALAVLRSSARPSWRGSIRRTCGVGRAVIIAPPKGGGSMTVLTRLPSSSDPSRGCAR
jgi:hypothetical protein